MDQKERKAIYIGVIPDIKVKIYDLNEVAGLRPTRDIWPASGPIHDAVTTYDDQDTQFLVLLDNHWFIGLRATLGHWLARFELLDRGHDGRQIWIAVQQYFGNRFVGHASTCLSL